MHTNRCWVAGLLAVSLSGCAESVVSQGALDCEVEGETRCDNTGGMEMVCAKDASGKLRFGTPTPCPGGRRCVDGKCPDLCGAPCTSPPDSCHKPLGTCWNGQCRYDPLEDGVACDDGNACTTGDACSGATCTGQKTECTTPPANVCKDGSTLTVYTTPGTCSEASCSYPSAEVPCPLGCEAGACKGDPCKGVTCTSPPSACHMNPGTCLAGSCSYLPEVGKSCNDSDACTTSDKCNTSAKCAGTPIACLTPPKNTCKDASTLLSYPKQGSCSKGVCSYPKSEVPCSHGCDSTAGACKGDPCAGVSCATPPAPTACYTSPGTCSDGKCSYAYADGKSCDDGNACTTGDKCTTGKCAGTPVVCNTPPKSTCKDASTLTVYAAPGACSSGTCSYGSASVTCSFGCDTASGACKGDPCATLTCTTPPNSQCYTVPGICSNGSCTYLPKTGSPCDDGNPCTKTDVCSASGGCAGTAYTCSDSLVCTKDTCNGTGGCSYPVDASSCLITIGFTPTCFQSGAFAPGNACQHCAPTKSQSAWSIASGTAEVTKSFDDGTLQGFTVTPSPALSPVKWQVDTKRADSAPNALYFGNLATHTFDDPDKVVKGEATSPTVALPTSAKLCLEWRMFKATESGSTFDQLSLTAQPAGTLLWKSGNEPSYSNGNTSGVFKTFIVDITALAGSSVQFRFAFDSFDEIANDSEGVYLDTIRVLKDCTP
jgi:hypothetical protein